MTLTPGGVAALVHTIRMMMELRPNFVCVCLDVRNAHNAMSRRAVVEVLEAVPGLQHLAQHAATCLAADHFSESGGETYGESGQGLAQGDSEASGLFCVGIQRHVGRLHSRLQAAGGLAIFGNDDGYAITSAAVVFGAVAEFTTNIFENCGLALQLTKTKIYQVTGQRPPEAPAVMPLAGVKVEEEWLPGFTCYGVEIGTQAYVRHKLGEKAKKLISDINKVMYLLRYHHQAAWVLLSTSLAHQLDYSLTLQYPSDILETASLLDRRLWAAVEQVAGRTHIPRQEEGMGVECVLNLPGLPMLEGCSFQALMVRQPVKLGVFGLRSLVETRFPAFVGGLEQALPLMVAGEL